MENRVPHQCVNNKTALWYAANNSFHDSVRVILETEINILFLHANNSYEQALTIEHGGSKRNILEDICYIANEQ